MEGRVAERTAELAASNSALTQRAAELEIINTVQQGLASHLDTQGIYELVGEKIREIFDAQAVLIVGFDHETRMSHTYYAVEKGVRLYSDPFPWSQLTEHQVRTGEVVLIDEDAIRVSANYGLKLVEGTEPPKSLLFVPLRSGGKVTGQVSLQNIDREHAFNESDVRLLTTLASSMSVALDNARLFDETKRLLAETEQRAAELGTVNAVSLAVTSEVELQALIRLIGDQVRDIFRADIAYVALHDLQTGMINFLYQHGEEMPSFPFGQGLTSEIITSAQPLLINRDRETHYAELGTRPIGREAGSYLGVPILARGKATGVISVQSVQEEGRFDDGDVRLLGTIAANVGAALENARLFAETRRLLGESEQRAEELAIINSTGEGLAKQLDTDAIIELVGSNAQEIFGGQDCFVALYDRMSDRVSWPYFVSNSRRIPIEPAALGPGLTAAVIRSRQPLVLGRAAEHEAYEVVIVQDGNPERTQSWMGVPILMGDEVIGVIAVQDYQANKYSERDVRLLSTIAANAGVALANARLFSETSRRAGEMAALNEIGREISATLDLNTVLVSIAERAQVVLNARDVLLRLVEPNGEMPAVVAIGKNAEILRASRRRVGEGITGSVAQTGVAQVLNDPQRDPRQCTPREPTRRRISGRR